MRPYSLDFRQKIIETHNNEDISIRKLAERFRVAKSFVQKLLKQYREIGDIAPRRSGGNPKPKLNEDNLVSLVEIIETNNDATLSELCELLEEKVKIRVSRATMAKIIKKLNYSFKKKTLYAAEKISEIVLNKRVKYWEKIKNLKAEDLIFIDESGINLAMVRLYARALKGQRARGEKPLKRGKNISIIGALSLSKLLASINIYGSVDAVTFEGFIRIKLVPKLWKNACVIMDNAKINLGEMVRKMIEEAGAQLVYLPPYSPEFSPIENFWSKVKSTLKKIGARTYKDLIDGITSAILKVTQENIHNWFTHCCYCTS